MFPECSAQDGLRDFVDKGDGGGRIRRKHRRAKAGLAWRKRRSRLVEGIAQLLDGGVDVGVVAGGGHRHGPVPRGGRDGGHRGRGSVDGAVEH